MSFGNVYEDDKRATAYSRLEFPGTYYLAFRDIPGLISKYVVGKQALDFGCGTGRSTRFLNNLGFRATGIDISEDMLKLARDSDPQSEYQLINNGDLNLFKDESFDLVLSAFAFDNIPTDENKIGNLREIRRVLKPAGIMINLVSSPEIYTHEWASFTTKDFPQNQQARSGDEVLIVMTDVDDHRPVRDIVWSDASYRGTYKKAGLEIMETHRPLGLAEEPYDWISETETAPWVIYVLKKKIYKQE